MIESNFFHALSIEETFKELEVTTSGLKDEEVKKRQSYFGKNTLEEETTSLFRIFFRQFKSIPIYVLFAASLVSIVVGEWLDCTVILGIVLINGLLGFWQEAKAEASLSALKKMTESRNKVVRNGEYLEVPSSELVPGDYILLQEGDVVTADVRLTESTGLMVDESSMTGESVPVIKDHEVILEEKALPYELTNMLLAGTVVVRGLGYGVVAKTGKKTYLASIAEKAIEASPKTPLNKAIDFFMRRFVLILIVVFILLGVIGFMQGRNLMDLSYILVAGLVSAVPEGFVVVVTLIMVLGSLALSKKHTLIRSLSSVETLGSVTFLASDKTGTITEGKLVVKEVYAKDLEKLKKIAALCNDANESSEDPLDIALSKWVENYDQYRANYPRVWTHPFDTHLMLMATVNKVDDHEELYIKGAFEVLKEKAEGHEEYEVALTSFLEQGLRVIAFGEGQWEDNTDPSSWKIKMVGLIGFLDPPKAGVKEAIISAKKAGIHILMITGDHPMTAKAIAQEVQIWEENDHIITGQQVEDFSDEELLVALKKSTVLARVLPEHKYRIVKLLQEAKEIVAVTGDGVNDVPALKAADIGIAMGSGTEAAKSVSQMVIVDSNLKVIIGAIRNARVISDNIRKVIYFLVSTTLQEVVLMVLAIISRLPLPLLAIQILWINLVGDGVQDKTFPFAKEEGNVMSRRPRRPEKQFFDGVQITRIFSFGLLVGLMCFFLYVYLIRIYSPCLVSTILFTCVTVAQWANGIQAQKEVEPFFKNVVHSLKINPYIYLGIGLGVLLQLITIYVAPKVFHVMPLEFSYWRYPSLFFIATFAIVEVRKWAEYLWSKKSAATRKKQIK